MQEPEKCIPEQALRFEAVGAQLAQCRRCVGFGHLGLARIGGGVRHGIRSQMEKRPARRGVEPRAGVQKSYRITVRCAVRTVSPIWARMT